jgi:phosphoribosylformylglycinamidine synthase subunit PurS
MKVRIHVSLKPGVLDPQGRAVHHALEGMGFTGIEDVRVGRLIELDVTDDTSDQTLNEMCRRLLANMVIENYRIEKLEMAE